MAMAQIQTFEFHIASNGEIVLEIVAQDGAKHAFEVLWENLSELVDVVNLAHTALQQGAASGNA